MGEQGARENKKGERKQRAQGGRVLGGVVRGRKAPAGEAGGGARPRAKRWGGAARRWGKGGRRGAALPRCLDSPGHGSCTWRKEAAAGATGAGEGAKAPPHVPPPLRAPLPRAQSPPTPVDAAGMTRKTVPGRHVGAGAATPTAHATPPKAMRVPLRCSMTAEEPTRGRPADVRTGQRRDGDGPSMSRWSTHERWRTRPRTPAAPPASPPPAAKRPRRAMTGRATRGRRSSRPSAVGGGRWATRGPCRRRAQRHRRRMRSSAARASRARPSNSCC
jgi:hypothetical protein